MRSSTAPSSSPFAVTMVTTFTGLMTAGLLLFVTTDFVVTSTPVFEESVVANANSPNPKTMTMVQKMMKTDNETFEDCLQIRNCDEPCSICFACPPPEATCIDVYCEMCNDCYCKCCQSDSECAENYYDIHGEYCNTTLSGGSGTTTTVAVSSGGKFAG